mmetsp:Transcript_7303/g.10680  ORF Transcript_7303/g.10680 Transcript_7303/m.10680 type:complete len:421 (-) Transcript_7303:60-1322(-)
MTSERSNLLSVNDDKASSSDDELPCDKERVSNQPSAGFSTAFTIALLPAIIIVIISATTLSTRSPRNNSSLVIEGKTNKFLKQCENDSTYTKHTVKTAYELPFAALFRDNKGQKKFEASSITIVNNEVYAVCDSSWAISKFKPSLLPFSDDNVQIGTPDRDGDFESGYEAIFHHEGSFYVIRESVLHHHNHDDGDEVSDGGEEEAGVDENHSYHAIIEEIILDDTDYTIKSQCSSEFEFEGTSKGFEGAIGFPDSTGTLYIIGLCEGNHCSEARKADAGHGRLVIMAKGEDENGNCVWKTYRIVHIPKSAYFIDYSDIDITNDGRVAITSQENSEVWIGTAVGISNGIIDPDKFGFDDDDDKTLQFPKSSDCRTIYCNIEGIYWMNSEMLMAVSDKMKSRGRQDFRCLEKDQSIHTFVLP